MEMPQRTSGRNRNVFKGKIKHIKIHQVAQNVLATSAALIPVLRSKTLSEDDTF